MTILYILLSFFIPTRCPGVDEWQVFIDADHNSKTGYVGYEYVVRGVLTDTLDLRDWQQLQNRYGETVDALWSHGTIIRETEGRDDLFLHGGWGTLVGFAQSTWVMGDERVEFLLPSLLGGRYRLEVYENGAWCP